MPLHLNEAEMSSIVEAGGGKIYRRFKGNSRKNGTHRSVRFATNKINVGQSDVAIDRGGCT
jgi:hypothetical protein